MLGGLADSKKGRGKVGEVGGESKRKQRKVAGEKQTRYPQTVSTFYLIWKGMLVCLKKDMRAFKLAMSPPVCTFSARRLQHIHTLKPRDHQCTSPSYEILLCGLGKSHVDHFTQSWTLDSNQSLSLL